MWLLGRLFSKKMMELVTLANRWGHTQLATEGSWWVWLVKEWYVTLVLVMVIW